MPHLGIERIEPGMVLMEDVVHMNGRILIRAGCEITEKNLKVLKTWGILTVNVAEEAPGADAEEAQTASPEQIHAAEERFRALFRHAELSHPALAEIHRYRVRRFLDSGS
ncbi:MAG: hypothetical protein IT488_05620 [Gammaproteobacteria bacterium]|nr:hypothetical protein [Gammaproteobacteria bacterium]